MRFRSPVTRGSVKPVSLLPLRPSNAPRASRALLRQSGRLTDSRSRGPDPNPCWRAADRRGREGRDLTAQGSARGCRRPGAVARAHGAGVRQRVRWPSRSGLRPLRRTALARGSQRYQQSSTAAGRPNGATGRSSKSASKHVNLILFCLPWSANLAMHIHFSAKIKQLTYESIYAPLSSLNFSMKRTTTLRSFFPCSYACNCTSETFC